MGSCEDRFACFHLFPRRPPSWREASGVSDGKGQSRIIHGLALTTIVHMKTTSKSERALGRDEQGPARVRRRAQRIPDGKRLGMSIAQNLPVAQSRHRHLTRHVPDSTFGVLS
ncbi:uncharacterized protein MELLADRAFT_106138 [Melampsora larici-populina 98AG31]|uniref:Uncharacterized protein n=1 Tax=Melampsora larici-populina (strain 98AG31 / pathotype 3-4-7) TaxID=747676 RepID=F4RKI6_MELLP|nr:uncharacterized protein MELLADRAFT_106138 [Melampsora larici-populina 98AG31]EGG07174.1 hypothetical protein MELLADRAFT_106138 [Melampsora larici-populina 98AG31]